MNIFQDNRANPVARHEKSHRRYIVDVSAMHMFLYRRIQVRPVRRIGNEDRMAPTGQVLEPAPQLLPIFVRDDTSRIISYAVRGPAIEVDRRIIEEKRFSSA